MLDKYYISVCGKDHPLNTTMEGTKKYLVSGSFQNCYNSPLEEQKVETIQFQNVIPLEWVTSLLAP